MTTDYTTTSYFERIDGLYKDSSRRRVINLVLMLGIFAFLGLYFLTDFFLFVVGEYVLLTIQLYNLYRIINNGRLIDGRKPLSFNSRVVLVIGGTFAAGFAFGWFVLRPLLFG